MPRKTRAVNLNYMGWACAGSLGTVRLTYTLTQEHPDRPCRTRLGRGGAVPAHLGAIPTRESRPEAGSTGSRGLRIAHFALGRTNPYAADGIDQTVYHLTRAQAALGHVVRLFSLTGKAPIAIPGVDVTPYPPITPSPLLLTRRLRDLLAWRAPWNLPRRLIDDLVAWKPDVLHLHGVHMAQHLRLARRARAEGIPYCVSPHGMLAPSAERRHRWLKRAGALVQRPFLDQAAVLHALSEQERDALRAYGTIAPVVVAPNGIDADALRPAAEPPDTPGSVDFLFLGRLDPEQKGLDLLLEGFAAAGIFGARLTLVGPDWRGSRAALEASAARLGVAAQVTFAGPAFGPHKLEALSRAHVFVHPSRWEGVSFSVLEAACLERPCLLTPAADPRGRLQQAGAAVVVAPSAEAIAAGLRTLADMGPAGRAAMGRLAREVIAAEFDWSRTAALLVAAYRAHPAPGRQP